MATSARSIDLDERIRQRARTIWQEEGCPDGCEKKHLDMAQEQIAIEDNQRLAMKPNPLQGDVRRDPSTGEPVEPLSVTENLDDFPTALTDQGDRQQTPLPRPR